MVCDIFTHVTHLVSFLQTGSTARSPTTTEPLPSVDNIGAIAELETHEDVIMMAREEIACLNDMSLEGDIPDNVSDSAEAREKIIFYRELSSAITSHN